MISIIINLIWIYIKNIYIFIVLFNFTIEFFFFHCYSVSFKNLYFALRIPYRYSKTIISFFLVFLCLKEFFYIVLHVYWFFIYSVANFIKIMWNLKILTKKVMKTLKLWIFNRNHIFMWFYFQINILWLINFHNLLLIKIPLWNFLKIFLYSVLSINYRHFFNIVLPSSGIKFYLQINLLSKKIDKEKFDNL